MDHPEELWTVEEVADRMKVNPETIRRWIRTGRLKAANIGRSAGYRVSESEIQRFLLWATANPAKRQ